MSDVGRVVAVCISSEGNVPKHPQDEVRVEQYGFAGDHHAGPTRISRRTKNPTCNDRQLSLVAREVLESLHVELGVSLKPGALGENITTEGLGDLSDITNGTLLRIGDSLVIKVTEQNNPCHNLSTYHRLLVKTIHGRRGLLAVVWSGAGSIIRPGDRIYVLERS